MTKKIDPDEPGWSQPHICTICGQKWDCILTLCWEPYQTTAACSCGPMTCGYKETFTLTSYDLASCSRAFFVAATNFSLRPGIEMRDVVHHLRVPLQGRSAADSPRCRTARVLHAGSLAPFGFSSFKRVFLNHLRRLMRDNYPFRVHKPRGWTLPDNRNVAKAGHCLRIKHTLVQHGHNTTASWAIPAASLHRNVLNSEDRFSSWPYFR